MDDKEIIHSYTQEVSLRVPDHEKRADNNSLLKKINSHYGWPGWNSLEANDGSVEPSEDCVSAHHNINRTQRVTVTVNVYADGTLSIAL